MKSNLIRLLSVILFMQLAVGAFAQESFEPYIPEEQMPDVVECVPAPPQDPSSEFDHDILRYMWGKQQRSSSQ